MGSDPWAPWAPEPPRALAQAWNSTTACEAMATCERGTWPRGHQGFAARTKNFLHPVNKTTRSESSSKITRACYTGRPKRPRGSGAPCRLPGARAGAVQVEGAAIQEQASQAVHLTSRGHGEPKRKRQDSPPPPTTTPPLKKTRNFRPAVHLVVQATQGIHQERNLVSICILITLGSPLLNKTRPAQNLSQVELQKEKP